MTFNIGSQSGRRLQRRRQSAHPRRPAGVRGGTPSRVFANCGCPRPGNRCHRASGRGARQVDEIEEAVQAGPEPNRGRAAQALDWLTRLLSGAGSLAVRVLVVEPLRALATWLGPLAERVVTMLPR